MKCDTPARAGDSSREPAPIQSPIEAERTPSMCSVMMRSPPGSVVRRCGSIAAILVAGAGARAAGPQHLAERRADRRRPIAARRSLWKDRSRSRREGCLPEGDAPGRGRAAAVSDGRCGRVCAGLEQMSLTGHRKVNAAPDAVMRTLRESRGERPEPLPAGETSRPGLTTRAGCVRRSRAGGRGRGRRDPRAADAAHAAERPSPARSARPASRARRPRASRRA